MKKKLILLTAIVANAAFSSSAAAKYYILIENRSKFNVGLSLNGATKKISPGEKTRYNGSSDQFSLSFDEDPSKGLSVKKYRLIPNSKIAFYSKGNRIDVSTVKRFPVPPPPPRPITRSVNDTLGNRKYASTTATLNPNGLLTVQSYTRSAHLTEALRCRIFIVLEDAKGRAVWVTKKRIKCKTRCATGDFFCESAGTQTFTRNVPAEVARITRNIRIYQSSHSVSTSISRWVKTINEGVRAAEDLDPRVKAIILGGL